LSCLPGQELLQAGSVVLHGMRWDRAMHRRRLDLSDSTGPGRQLAAVVWACTYSAAAAHAQCFGGGGCLLGAGLANTGIKQSTADMKIQRG